MNELLEKLSAPFPPDRISWRVGSTNQAKTKGMALGYLDARDVQDRLNEVCGSDWQCEHIVSNQGTKVTCRIGIKFGDQWVWRSNGAGETDYEADKGSYSDSFKRAAVLFGVGRYLYDLSAPWVEIEPMGKSFKIKDSELARLAKSLGGAPKHDDQSASEVAALNAINACKSREEITALLNREKDNFSTLPNGGADRVRARANERLTVEFPKPKLKEAS